MFSNYFINQLVTLILMLFILFRFYAKLGEYPNTKNRQVAEATWRFLLFYYSFLEDAFAILFAPSLLPHLHPQNSVYF